MLLLSTVFFVFQGTHDQIQFYARQLPRNVCLASRWLAYIVQRTVARLPQLSTQFVVSLQRQPSQSSSLLPWRWFIYNDASATRAIWWLWPTCTCWWLLNKVQFSLTSISSCQFARSNYWRAVHASALNPSWETFKWQTMHLKSYPHPITLVLWREPNRNCGFDPVSFFMVCMHSRCSTCIYTFSTVFEPLNDTAQHNFYIRDLAWSTAIAATNLNILVHKL